MLVMIIISAYYFCIYFKLLCTAASDYITKKTTFTGEYDNMNSNALQETSRVPCKKNHTHIVINIGYIVVNKCALTQTSHQGKYKKIKKINK